MSRAGLAACILTLAACGSRDNPNFCDESSPCKNGSACNLATNACEPIDAAPIDVPIDGPFIARTVQEIRATSTPENTLVELEDVVVTAVDSYGIARGDFWVQDEGGGPASGIHVFAASAAGVETLAIGDVIGVGRGRKHLRMVAGDITGRREIGILASIGGTLTLTKKGRTATPVVASVDANAIALLGQPQLDEARETWAGMLVRVSDVRATSAPSQVSSDATFLQFSIGAFFVQSRQAPFPSDIMQSTCFSSITGVVEYFDAYNLMPQRTSDTVITTCP